MKDRTFNNADSFAMSFDEEWQKLECHDDSLKIKKIIDLLSDHPGDIISRVICIFPNLFCMWGVRRAPKPH